MSRVGRPRKQHQIVRWEAPEPAKDRGGYERYRAVGPWDTVAYELKCRRGEWALILQDRSSTRGLVTQINKGQLADFLPVGHWEATGRGSGSARRVYCRYIGPEV
jgi:hypothetical protein